MLLWTGYFWVDDTMHNRADFQLWVGHLLFGFCLLGMEGCKVKGLGMSPQREGFRSAAGLTWGALPCGMLRLGQHLLAELVGEPTTSDNGLNIALAGGVTIVSGIICKPFNELAMTAYYRFMTRRIPALYWLPQNGAGKEFDPWWSRQLRLTIFCYTLFLAHALLAAIHAVSRCRQ